MNSGSRAIPLLSSILSSSHSSIEVDTSKDSNPASLFGVLRGIDAIALPIQPLLAKPAKISTPSKSSDSEVTFQVIASSEIVNAVEKVAGINIVEQSLIITSAQNSESPPTGKVGDLIEITFAPTSGNRLTRIFLVGIGSGSGSDLRKAGAILGRKVKASSTHLLSTCATNALTVIPHTAAMALACYSWTEKTGPLPLTPKFSVLGNYEKEIEKCKILVKSVWNARNLIHTPANVKTPIWLAAQAKSLAKNTSLTVRSRGGKEISEFGGLRAVGNSSLKNPPRFVEISYVPRGSKNWPHVVLVGKGITFDTGGISLKRPYDAMMGMKSDMAGAAAVLATLLAVAEIGAKVRVTGLMMCAENALSGSAQRPSDVITHYGGTTVEVINTDAEGRLVLADGLAYADKNLNPDYLVDIATLTGAISLGLGQQYAGMYTRDRKLARELHEIGETSGDRVWHMPLIDDYLGALESDLADYNHTAGAAKFSAGSVTAALFLEKFVGKRNWVHLDIAGTGRSEVDSGENPKGGTGFGVRLLTEWITSL